MTPLVYSSYRHSIRTAYHSLGLIPDISDFGLGFPEYETILNLGKEQIVDRLIPSIKARLGMVGDNLLVDFLENGSSTLRVGSGVESGACDA